MADARALTRPAAARYCSLSLSGFDDWVARGLLPGPIPGTKRWDRKAIDLALDRASGFESASPFLEWRRSRESADARR